MNKEEIEKAKEDLNFFDEGDYITKDMEHSADVLEEYIQNLEQENKQQKEELEMYKDFKEIANTKIGDANPLKVLEVNKMLDRQCKRLKSVLDKVTDKLKEKLLLCKEEKQLIEGSLKSLR